MRTPPEPTNTRLPVWAQIGDGLTLLLAVAALRVAILGGIRIGTFFSMSTPWRALVGLVIICGVRHYLIRTSPLHARLWGWLRSAWSLLAPFALRCGRSSLSAFNRTTRMPTENTLHLFALAALAVAQPLFDVVSREPAFFVARNTTAGQLAGLVVILAVGLPLGLVAIEAIFARLHDEAGKVVHAELVTVLGIMTLLPVLKRLSGMDAVPLIAVSALLAALVAFAVHYYRAVQMFLTAMSPAAVVVPVLFLANPDIREAVVVADGAGNPAEVERAPPIVFVVLDEFPTNSLMNRDREIDRRVFPNFARLADDATWFRNASTVSSQTVWSVPAMVSGRYPVEPGAVPTLRYYPNNLFTMLSDSYEMTVFGRFLQLCPAGVCTYDLEVHDTLWDLAADLGVVYLHILAPESLAGDLPPIVGDWRGFADRRRFRDLEGDRRSNDRAVEFGRFLATITSDTSGRLYFLHTLTPHMPFEFVPSGARYRPPRYQGRQVGGARLFLNSDPWLPVVLQQQHLLQVGFVDTFIGNLVDRMQRLGIYDEALIIVTGDHGASWRHGERRRGRTDTNLADILLVPLFVKLPHQAEGAVSDRTVETVDIVPTIAEALGATVPYELDGRPLLDRSGPARLSRTFVQRNYERVRVETYAADLEDLGLEHKLLHFESGLYGVGPHGSWVGREVSSLEPPANGAVTATLANRSAFENVNRDSASLPVHVQGTFTADLVERVSVGISVNGVLVATTVSFLEEGEWMFASMIPEDVLVAGSNDVEVLVLGTVSADGTQG